MTDLNSTTPLGTETTPGVATNGDAAITVLSFNANEGDGIFASIPSTVPGYWRTGDMVNVTNNNAVEWRPIPAQGLNLTLVAKKGAFVFQVKRVPAGTDVSDIRAGRINLLQPVSP